MKFNAPVDYTGNRYINGKSNTWISIKVRSSMSAVVKIKENWDQRSSFIFFSFIWIYFNDSFCRNTYILDFFIHDLWPQFSKIVTTLSSNPLLYYPLFTTLSLLHSLYPPLIILSPGSLYILFLKLNEFLIGHLVIFIF